MGGSQQRKPCTRLAMAGLRGAGVRASPDAKSARSTGILPPSNRGSVRAAACRSTCTRPAPTHLETHCAVAALASKARLRKQL